MRHLLLSSILGLALAGTAAQAEGPVKIGLLTTLSGPAGYLGEDIRDGFQLAIDLGGGTLGGRAVEVVAVDDGQNPGNARQVVERLLNEDIRLFTGIIFANLAATVVPEVLDNEAIYISSNTASATFAGAGCHPNYFVSSWQDDGQGESAGAVAQSLGYQRAFLVAPNYQAGRETMEAFRRTFRGEVIGELFTNLDQTDFSSELAQIRAANPDVVYEFQPGGLGIAFIRQYQQAGLLGQIPMVLHPASLNHVTLNAVGEAASGLYVSSHWNTDLDNPVNQAFLAAWRAKYPERPLTWYAAQGYDAALMFAAGLQNDSAGGDDVAAFRSALLAAEIPSVRGSFQLGQNQHPIQDWYALRAVKTAAGTMDLVTESKVLTAHGDVHAPACKL